MSTETKIAPFSIWYRVMRKYSLRTEAMPEYQYTVGATANFLARTLKKTSNGGAVSYTVMFNNKHPITIKTLVHELAHIVAWERPELKAKGHNMAYMDILYTLEEELGGCFINANLKRIVEL